MPSRAAVASLIAVLVALHAGPAAGEETTVVNLVAFSDYHSHAVAFYSEGRPGQGGVARAIAHLSSAKRQPNTIVISGGDMLNRGAPTWSDEYRCVEWPWFATVVDMMALGNHDLDYGVAELDRCRALVEFPILCANLLRGNGRPLLPVDGKPYLVRQVGGVRLGFFAVAGPDMPRLVSPRSLPGEVVWAPAISTARDVVDRLRSVEGVDAVISIGHQSRQDDEALARAVPGIDLILGTHPHDKAGLQKIPNTDTYYISPFQYLAYVSEVRLEFQGRTLRGLTGRLVKMDETRPEDPGVAAEVARLMSGLEQRHPELFVVRGRALVELSNEGIATDESVLGNWATEVLRQAAGAHVFFAMASGFRAGLAPGEITLEDLRGALPYENKIVTAQMTGQQILDWLELSVSSTGSSGFCQQTGLRYRVWDGHPDFVQILREPARRELGHTPLDPAARYTVGTSDFQALRAEGYRELFAEAVAPVKTGLDFHEVLLGVIQEGPIAAAVDGRGGEPAPR